MPTTDGSGDAPDPYPQHIEGRERCPLQAPCVDVRLCSCGVDNRAALNAIEVAAVAATDERDSAVCPGCQMDPHMFDCPVRVELLESELEDARMMLGAVVPLLTQEQAAAWREQTNRFKAERAAARARA